MPPWRPWTVLTEVFIFCLLGLDCEVGQKEVKVTQGEDATLECYGSSGATDILLRWTKPDQKIQGYVFYLKDGHFQEDLQDPSFKGRVEPKDSKWMNNGNFSVILQNVTMKDSGTYECEAAYNKQAAQLLKNITLRVVDPPGQPGGQSGDGGKEDGGEKSGSVGLIVGLPVSAVLVVVPVVGFVIYRKCRNSNYQSPSKQGQQMEMSS